MPRTPGGEFSGEGGVFGRCHGRSLAVGPNHPGNWMESHCGNCGPARGCHGHARGGSSKLRHARRVAMSSRPAPRHAHASVGHGAPKSLHLKCAITANRAVTHRLRYNRFHAPPANAAGFPRTTFAGRTLQSATHEPSSLQHVEQAEGTVSTGEAGGGRACTCAARRFTSRRTWGTWLGRSSSTQSNVICFTRDSRSPGSSTSPMWTTSSSTRRASETPPCSRSPKLHGRLPGMPRPARRRHDRSLSQGVGGSAGDYRLEGEVERQGLRLRRRGDVSSTSPRSGLRQALASQHRAAGGGTASEAGA